VSGESGPDVTRVKGQAVLNKQRVIAVEEHAANPERRLTIESPASLAPVQAATSR
jgi:hypothetical protein